jgi:uncharacterized protein
VAVQNINCKKNENLNSRGQTISVGGLISKIFNIQTRKFSTLTCQTCGFTEFFERYQNPISNIIDIFIR